MTEPRGGRGKRAGIHIKGARAGGKNRARCELVVWLAAEWGSLWTQHLWICIHYLCSAAPEPPTPHPPLPIGIEGSGFVLLNCLKVWLDKGVMCVCLMAPVGTMTGCNISRQIYFGSTHSGTAAGWSRCWFGSSVRLDRLPQKEFSVVSCFLVTEGVHTETKSVWASTPSQLTSIAGHYQNFFYPVPPFWGN